MDLTSAYTESPNDLGSFGFSNFLQDATEKVIKKVQKQREQLIFQRLKELGQEKNVIASIMDSTRVKEEGKTPSERIARELVFDTLHEAENEDVGVFVTTFSSHIARIKSITEAAKEMGRRPILLGRSMERYTGTAEQMGLVELPDNVGIFGSPQGREEILKKTRLAGKFEKRAEELRAKLLMFRLQRYHEITVKEDVNYDIPDNVEGRVREIAEGFFDIIEHSDLRDKIRNFLSDHQEDIVEERSNSEEGMILYIIYKNWINNGKEPVDLWSGKISDEIEGYYDIELKPEQIGRLLKTLDIDTKLKTVWIDVNEDKEKSRKRCIIWNMDKLKNKFDRYVPEFEREDSNNSEDDNSNLDDFDKNDNDQTLMENIRDTMINEGKKEIPQNTIIDSVPGETKEITNMIQKMINKGYITDKGCGIYSLNTK